MKRYGILALVLTGLAGGCAPQEREVVEERVEGIRQQVSQATEQARQRGAEAALAARVKTALATRKGVNAEEIEVEVQGSTVTLRGDVASREEADLAVETAQETEGVTAVENELMVRVPARLLPRSPEPVPPPAPEGGTLERTIPRSEPS